MGKGENFERLISRKLSLWFTNGERDDLYWRNRNRSRKIKSKYQLGDIVCEVSEGEALINLFSIEIKTGYSKTKKGKKVKNIPWDLLDIIDYVKHKNKPPPKSQLKKFWSQTKRDAEISMKEPLLIFKRDFHDSSIMIERSMYNELIQYSGNSGYTILTVEDDDINCVIMRLESFFSWIDAEIIKLIVKMKEEES